MNKSCCNCRSKIVCKIWNPERSRIGDTALSLISENNDIESEQMALKLNDEAEKKAGEIFGVLCPYYHN